MNIPTIYEKLIMKIFIFMLIGYFVIACSSADAYKNIPKPDEAYDVKEYDLEKESAHQLTYKIDRPYPGDETIEFYVNHYLSINGWSVCEGENRWSELIKKDNSNNTFIPTKQNISYFANKKINKLLLLKINYYADSVSAINQIKSWDDDRQNVTIALYNLSEDDYSKTLKMLKLKC